MSIFSAAFVFIVMWTTPKTTHVVGFNSHDLSGACEKAKENRGYVFRIAKNPSGQSYAVNCVPNNPECGRIPDTVSVEPVTCVYVPDEKTVKPGHWEAR